ncbi:DUF6221 family protein [Streptomyces cacaoi]
MTDLHGWITQQVDQVEAAARDASEGPWFAEHPEGRWGEEHDAVLIGQGKPLATLPYDRNGHLNADHIELHNPAAVLRRCEADRRILADHCLVDTGYSVACEACGTAGICQDWVTDNINDCPMLLAIAHAHGITEEILASLDRPQAPEVTPRAMGQLAAQLWTGQIRTSMRDVPEPLRGPNWSSR